MGSILKESALYALLIGIDWYQLGSADSQRPSMNLAGCVNDINQVEVFLRDEVGIPGNHIRKLTATNSGTALPPEPEKDRPTRENIIRAFKTLSNSARPGDQLYIHYSGHGARVKTPARFLKLKPGYEFDEALVPCDFSYEKDNFLRDFEVAHLLQTYVEKDLLVTLVLDSCHSGGATRSQPLRPDNTQLVARTIGTVNQFLPPAEIAVATDEELVISRRTRLRDATRDLEVGNNWLLEPRNYALLAACRPSEYAYEHPFNGIDRSGVLTFWFLDSLRILGINAPLKSLYERILAKVHTQFPTQTPQLQGAAHRSTFKRDWIPSVRTVAVLEVSNNEVTLNIGQAQGIRTGARFNIIPAGEFNPLTATKRALVTVETLGATISRATIVEEYVSNSIQPGDQAVQLENENGASTSTFKLISRIGTSDKELSTCLSALKEAEKQFETRLVKLADSNVQTDFTVSISDDRKYVISDPEGRAIENMPSGPGIDEAQASLRLMRFLAHLSKYQNVAELENHDPYSPLRAKLSMELLGCQRDYVIGNPPEPKPLRVERGSVKVRSRDWIFVRIRNNSTRVLNLTVLDLRPNWSIRQIFPAMAAQYEPLDPGQALILPMQAALPLGFDEGTSIIKGIGTLGPSNFRCLELGALHHSQDTVWRGSDSETDFSKALSPNQGSHEPGNEHSGSHDWTSSHLEIKIRREENR